MDAPQASRRRVYRTTVRTAARIPCDLWSRPAFARLDTSTQHLYLLVRMSDEMGQSGVSRLEIQAWSEQAQADALDVHRMLNTMWSSGLLDIDYGHSELFIPDLLLAEVTRNDGDAIERAAQDAVTVKTERFRRAIAEAMHDDINTARSRLVGECLISGRPLPERGRVSLLAREELAALRTAFANCPERRALRAEIDAGMHVCARCGIASGQWLEVDHIVSLARGGANARANYQVLCDPCNNRKGASV